MYLVLAAELGRVRVTQVLKACRGHGEPLGLGTVRGQKRPLVKVEPQWQLKALD